MIGSSRSAPPKDQAAYERWSLVFFLRPANDVTLRALSDESPLIADAVAKSGEPAKFNPGQTAQEWFFRRNRGMRTNVIAAKVHALSSLYSLTFPLGLIVCSSMLRALRHGVLAEAQSTAMTRYIFKGKRKLLLHPLEFARPSGCLKRHIYC